jgi:mannitol-specific phosphotransferase system IIBC component
MENLLQIMGRMIVYVLPVLIHVVVIFLKRLTQAKTAEHSNN